MPAIRFVCIGLYLACVGSCRQPQVPDGEARIVTVQALARKYKEDKANADLAFTGQTVRVLINFVANHPDRLELPWQPFYGAAKYPPTVLFRFAETSPRPADLKPGCWIEGTCRGRVDDGQDRGLPGYTFTVVVDGCRVHQP